jgi:hypothetical protein
VLNLRLFCTNFYTDVVILICHLLHNKTKPVFLNLFCLCSFHSRIYDTVSYQLESNQVNQIRHEDGDGHHLSSSQQPFNLLLIANQTISDSFLEMCSPVKFAHSLSKKSRTVSSWELCIICQISCDDTKPQAEAFICASTGSIFSKFILLV